jgi:hypothetical protein
MLGLELIRVCRVKLGLRIHLGSITDHGKSVGSFSKLCVELLGIIDQGFMVIFFVVVDGTYCSAFAQG